MASKWVPHIATAVAVLLIVVNFAQSYPPSDRTQQSDGGSHHPAANGPDAPAAPARASSVSAPPVLPGRPITASHASLESCGKDQADTSDPFVIWSSDFHITPIADIKSVLPADEFRVIDKSLSGHCHLTNTCATDLKVLTPKNAINMHCRYRKQFFEAYAQDPEFAAVHAGICTLVIGNCELFMGFPKSIILYIATRYDLGRNGSPDTWKALNENILRIASKPYNAVVANNVFDALYTTYFTGIAPPPIIPPAALYTNATYNPTQPEVLFAPARGLHPAWQAAFDSWRGALEVKIPLSSIRALYPQYTFDQLARHPAIIFFPYQTSLMSFFEWYRMGIPILAPSLRYMARMHVEHGVLEDLILPGVHRTPPPARVCRQVPQAGGAALEPPLFSSQELTAMLVGDSPPPQRLLDEVYCFDPTKQTHLPTMQFWLQFSDIYVYPHIMLFDSMAEIPALLDPANLAEVSRRMMAFNRADEERILALWRGIAARLRREQCAAFAGSAPMSHDEFLMATYGEQLRDECG
mmetsp:Transcript_23224/g.74743  ORF Transcript_23224/g.74743 Transcript_23224/m.74743 type:complete len:525 (-) Transcript_23224:210-1784(-)